MRGRTGRDSGKLRQFDELKLIHQEQNEEEGSVYRLLHSQEGYLIFESLNDGIVKRRIVTVRHARTWLLMNIMPLNASRLFPEATIKVLDRESEKMGMPD